VAKPRGIPLVLTPLEAQLAVAVGTCRQEESVRAGLKDRHGFDGKRGLELHIEGAGGEIAFAKAFGLYPGFTVNTFKAADVGANVQVRTRSERRYGLIVRAEDLDTDVFVHVIGILPAYSIMGWMYGAEAKKPGYLATHGERPPAYFVPSEELRDLGELQLAPIRLPQEAASPSKEYPF
jgi:hypothetical protein